MHGINICFRFSVSFFFPIFHSTCLGALCCYLWLLARGQFSIDSDHLTVEFCIRFRCVGRICTNRWAHGLLRVQNGHKSMEFKVYVIRLGSGMRNVSWKSALCNFICLLSTTLMANERQAWLRSMQIAEFESRQLTIDQIKILLLMHTWLPQKASQEWLKFRKIQGLASDQLDSSFSEFSTSVLQNKL